MDLENSKEEKKKINIKEILKKSITRDILTNIVYSLLVVIYFICFNTQCTTFETSILIQYINISSLTFLAIGIIILEASFRKNKKKISLYGIEFLILAIATLLIKHIPKIPNVWAEFKPNNDQVEVLSAPNIKLDKGTHIDDDTLTIQTIYDENHINVPITANLRPTALSIHE